MSAQYGRLNCHEQFSNFDLTDPCNPWIKTPKKDTEKSKDIVSTSEITQENCCNME